jgi:hypothetical protein
MMVIGSEAFARGASGAFVVLRPGNTRISELPRKN